MKSILYGDGTNRCPWYVHKFRAEETTQLEKIFDLCDREGIKRLSIAYSKLYYLRRSNGWWLTSDYSTTDKVHGLPPEGRLITRR